MVEPYFLGSPEIGIPQARAVAYATSMDNGGTGRDIRATEAGRQAGRWLDVKQAAEELGISSDAVRKRIARGTLPSRKEQDGSVWVRLDGADDRRDDGQPYGGTEAGHRLDELLDAKDEALRDLRDQLAHMRRESERKDAIIMQMAQANGELSRTVRALEAPHHNGHEDAQEDAQETPRDEVVVEEGERDGGPEKRSWWSRLFG